MSKEIKINFKPELFCPMYWYAGEAIENPEIRYVFAYGGSSASKTYSIVQKLITETILKGADTIVLRKNAVDIDRSIYKDFKLVINNWGLQDFFTFQKHKIICKENKAEILFSGLEDPENVKGITGFTYLVMEEFNQFDFEDFKQVRNRMRGLPNQKIICIWNPIDELHWVKKNAVDAVDEDGVPTQKWVDYHIKDRDFITGNKEKGFERHPIADYITTLNIQTSKINEKGNAVLLHTNYKDNWYISGHPNGVDGFRDDHAIENFEQLRNTDFDYYRVYALGLWGQADKGNEFYKNFDTKRHVRSADEITNDITMPLHISFDENVNPFLTLTVWQGSGHSVRLIGELCNPNPRNTLDAILYDFKLKYPPKRGNKMIFLYGDSTSRKEDVKQEKGKDFYTIIESTLEKYGYEVRRRVPSKNPNVSVRGGFINRIFSKLGYKGIDIKCSDAAINSVQDYMYVKEDADGKKFKKMIKDKETGVRYQERGHTSDANDYFLIEYFKREFQYYLDGENQKPLETFDNSHKFDF